MAVHRADETAEARVFGFEQGVEFAQGGAVRAVDEEIYLPPTRRRKIRQT